MAGRDIRSDHGSMDPLHLEVLDVNHERLVTSLKATAVIDRLLREEVISRDDYDQFRRTEGQGPKAMNRLLIMTLRRRGGNAYPSLVRAMRATGQDKLCEVMSDLEVNIKEGIDTARLERQYAHLNGKMDLNGMEDLSPRGPIRSPISPAGLQRKDQGNSLWSASPVLDTTGSRDPSPSRTAGDRDEKVQQLQKELEEVKQSRSQMEKDLKQKIEQLEKENMESKSQAGDKEEGKKKDKGCSVM